MYFIRIKTLKARLRERTLSDREALPYYGLLMAGTVLACSPALSAPRANEWDVLSTFVLAATTVVGVIYTYSRNGGKTGYDFIQKSIILGWVLTFRLLPIIAMSYTALWLAKRGLGQETIRSSWLDVVWGMAIAVLFYQRLGKHLRDTDASIEHRRHDG